jgi:hypothetical protein
LLVVTARDTENVALEFVAESIARDFLRHALIVESATIARKERERETGESRLSGVYGHS